MNIVKVAKQCRSKWEAMSVLLFVDSTGREAKELVVCTWYSQNI